MKGRKKRVVRKRLASDMGKASPRVNLKAFLARNNIAFEFLAKKTTKHAEEASRVTGIPLKSFAKTLIFVNESGRPFVAILRGDLQVNRHLLQKLTGFKSVKTAPVELAEKVAGFPTGGIPPIGHKTKMPTFIDWQLLRSESVWCGGGSKSKLVRLLVRDVLRMSKGKVAPFSLVEKKKP